jgi:DNA-binding transcriptional LysR family regulator
MNSWLIRSSCAIRGCARATAANWHDSFGLWSANRQNVVEHVSSLDMMLTLVGAGYGVGFTTATQELQSANVPMW